MWVRSGDIFGLLRAFDWDDFCGRNYFGLDADSNPRPFADCLCVGQFDHAYDGALSGAYEMFGLEAVSSGLDMAVFVILGAIIGVVAPGFLQLMSATKSYVARTGMPLVARLTLGGFILGLLLLLTPEVAGNGYSVVRSLLHDDRS